MIVNLIPCSIRLLQSRIGNIKKLLVAVLSVIPEFNVEQTFLSVILEFDPCQTGMSGPH